MKNLQEYLNEQLLESKLERGSWHGNDAWVLFNDKDDDGTVTILVGGHSEAEAQKVKKLMDAEKPLGEYEDFIEYVDYDEWEDQQ